jgi:hypothetical protein
VPFADLDAAIHAMSDGADPTRATWHASAAAFAPAWRSSPARACPRCIGPMRFGTLFNVPIDRCDAHGYWFDAGKLQSVLYAAAPQPPPDRIGTAGVVVGALGGLGDLLQILGIFLP